ncbi:MBL fold metallo-hydrolase [Pseudolysinimonas sp.]|uniref:MBL fold metallo-hydrolase n=1 Tax=Pseudolysinimonas sp. TaxID=2680009 RepID=UPI00286A7827|nr:MBL fold metallo-hydrolase [Pseudolysinimonas sp.]
MTGVAVTYLGGPTVLLEYAGLRILTDPTFDPPGEYADPGSTTLVKTAGPGLTLAAIEPVDAILLSHHEHPDNLDAAGRTLVGTGIPTLTTPYAAAGLDLPGATGLEPWATAFFEAPDGPITVTGVPALHGPPGSEEWVGPVTGFLLEAPGAPSVYVSGDNADLDLVDEIAARFAPVGVAVLFVGAARVPAIDGQLTLTSVDAVAATRMLGARAVVGVHTEDWEHFSESRADLEAAFAAAGIADLLVATPRGIRVEIP